MSSEVFEIPRHGAAGVAFLGAEFKDAVILLASVPLGLVLGHLFGVLFYVLVPWLGFVANKQYVDWLAKSQPGRLRLWLYELGLVGYSPALVCQQLIVQGDARPICRGTAAMLDQIIADRMIADQDRLAAASVAANDLRSPEMPPDRMRQGSWGSWAPRPTQLRSSLPVARSLLEGVGEVLGKGMRDGVRDGV